MIPTLLRVSLLNLRRDKVAWLLVFVVPIIIFTVFAIIFGGMKTGGTPRVTIAVVDEDESDVSRRLVGALATDSGLTVRTERSPKSTDTDQTSRRLDRDLAMRMVRDGDVPVAVIIPAGLGKSFPNFEGKGPTLEMLADTSDPVAPQMVAGLLQKAVMTGIPDAFLQGGIGEFEKYAGKMTPEQRKAVDAWLPTLKDKRPKPEGDKAGASPSFGLVSVKTTDVLGEKKANPAIAFYAAATGVMFLLFACANGGGGVLLEEVESGTLDRLLSSNLSLTQLLVGKWLWLVLLGVLQTTVMFLWGAFVFRVELFSHLPGFVVMTVVTAAAASSFGLVLGTLCKSRGQLAGVSTTVILLMSAVGGSMFPRFLMSEGMRTAGLFTFNAWALDGYQKVFWRDAVVWELWPQVVVLSGLAVAFLAAARVLARRWETS
jgi:ABC-2 type transport system permease protein